MSIKSILLVATFMCGCSSMLLAQTGERQPILQIQEDYQEGRIDVNTAALEQFRLMYDAEKTSPGKNEFVKCATPAFMFLHQHEEELSPAVLSKIKNYQEADHQARSQQLLESYITGSGKFEIFYKTSGDDSVSIEDENNNDVPDYVEWVGEAADSSYRHEVINIGFKDPIPAGLRYKIYLENNLPGGAYGYTEHSTTSPGGTKIVVETDFDNFPLNTDPEGHQKGAIKATVAHELKHAIQYVTSKWRSPAGSFGWSEMDATLMEEVVYDDVNDYYNYIKNGLNSSTPHPSSIFANPTKSVPGAPFPYPYVTWMIYFSEAFGNNLWKDVWELIEDDNTIGIDEALVELLPGRKTDFGTAFTQNHLWHLASGSRAGSDEYGFKDKNEYPSSKMNKSFTGVPVEETDMGSINHLAARYFEVVPSGNDGGLIEVAIDFDSTEVGMGLLLYMHSGEMVEFIETGKNKAQVYIPTELNWEDIERLEVVIANPNLSNTADNLTLSFGKNGNPVTIRDPDYADLPEHLAVYQNYPNPFNPKTTIRFEMPHSAFVELEVYDISGRKVQTLVNENRRFGRYEEKFNGSSLASGIYIYRLRIDDEVFIKKMTLVK